MLAPPVARHKALRRRILIVLALSGALLALLALFAVIDLLRIRHDLERGQQTLSTLDFATVDKHGGLTAVATSAAADLHRAARRADTSPWLSVLAHVPVVGDQVDAVRDLSNAADRVGQLSEATATDVQASLDHAAGAGPAGRVQLIDALTTATDRVQAGLGTIEVGADGWLLPPLRSAREDLVGHLDRAGTRLEDGRATLATLRGFLVGPRRYLILGGNNAEMRSTGIATTSGVATIHDGVVDVGEFLNNAATTIAKPGVPLPPGWDWLFGFLDPNIEYANMVSSPNFPLTGATAAALSVKNVQGPVDGVIHVDTVALQGLLSVVGPVTVDGVTYDGENAVQQLVNENYIRFADDKPERKEAQGRVARAIFDALNTRDIPLIKLAAKMQDLARARHLAAWSSRTAEQTLWEDVGADGARSPNDLLVASEELGTSKLDYYVTEHVNMTVQPEGRYRRIELAISLTNPPREHTSPYIEGGTPLYAEPGEYGTYLVAFLPKKAVDVVHDDPSYTSSADDGPFSVHTFTTRVPIGTTKTITLSFLLPNEETTLNIIPAARIAPVVWNWGRYRFDDTLPTALNLAPIAVESDVPLPGWLLSGLLLFAIGAVLAGNAWGRPATRQTRIDSKLGSALVLAGVAMMVAQAAIYITAL